MHLPCLCAAVCAYFLVLLLYKIQYYFRWSACVGVVHVGSRKKRPAKKMKGKDADDASGSEDDVHDESNIEKVTYCS